MRRALYVMPDLHLISPHRSGKQTVGRANVLAQGAGNPSYYVYTTVVAASLSPLDPRISHALAVGKEITSMYRMTATLVPLSPDFILHEPSTSTVCPYRKLAQYNPSNSRLLMHSSGSIETQECKARRPNNTC